MTRDEVRAKLLSRKVVPFEHGGIAFHLRLPTIDQVERALGLKSERMRDSFLAHTCLIFDGAPVLESIEEALRMAADEAPIIDAAAKAITAAILPKPKPTYPKGMEPMEVPESARLAAEAAASESVEG